MARLRLVVQGCARVARFAAPWIRFRPRRRPSRPQHRATSIRGARARRSSARGRAIRTGCTWAGSPSSRPPVSPTAARARSRLDTASPCVWSLRHSGRAHVGRDGGRRLAGAAAVRRQLGRRASSRGGRAGRSWPVALSLALLAGATAPIINGIVVGSNFTTPCPPGAACPQSWTTFEREVHLVAAGVAGFAGAFLPYLVPPPSWAAARELDHLRVGADARGVSSDIPSPFDASRASSTDVDLWTTRTERGERNRRTCPFSRVTDARRHGDVLEILSSVDARERGGEGEFMERMLPRQERGSRWS